MLTRVLLIWSTVEVSFYIQQRNILLLSSGKAISFFSNYWVKTNLKLSKNWPHLVNKSLKPKTNISILSINILSLHKLKSELNWKLSKCATLKNQKWNNKMVHFLPPMVLKEAVVYLIFLLLFFLSVGSLSLFSFSTLSFFSFLGWDGNTNCCVTCCWETSWETGRGFLHPTEKKAGEGGGADEWEGKSEWTRGFMLA